jgi:starch synthase (maltosyl-transferring)
MFGGIKIYDLVPNLLGKIVNWVYYFNDIKNMGFNCIHMKDDYSLKNIFFNGDQNQINETELTQILNSAHALGLKVTIDLIINHEHAFSDNKDIWKQYLDYIIYLTNMGYDGFKCIEPHKINQNLWIYLIDNVKAINPNIEFWGETLDCSSEDTIKVAEAGFDYVFNSSKWWNFKEDWFLIEYKKIAGCAPTISFPEYYEGEKTISDNNFNINFAKVRYVFASLFSTGVLIPSGFEFGFTNNSEEKSYNISDFIKKINEIKDAYTVFNEDNIIDILCTVNDNLLVFTKYSLDKTHKAIIIINNDLYNYQQCWFEDIYSMMDNKLIFDSSPYNEMSFIPKTYEYHLAPGEVRVLISK